MEFMLDTNMCIYIIKQKPPDVIKRIYQTEISEVGFSSITLSELLYGVSKSSKPEQNQIALAQFIAPLDILSYDDEAAQNYGELRAYLEKHGKPIGPLDMLIAAHALSTKCVLITNNEQEFIRVPNLKIGNWVNPKVA